MANYNQYLREGRAPAAASLVPVSAHRAHSNDDDVFPSLDEILKSMTTTSYVTQQVTRPIETPLELSTVQMNALGSRDQPIMIDEPCENPTHTRSGLAAALDDDAPQQEHNDSVQAVQSDDASSSKVDAKTCKTSGGVHHHAMNQGWGVRKIVAQRRTESGDCEFRVVWEDSWIEESDLEGAKELLREFKAKMQPQGARLLRSRAQCQLQTTRGG